MSTPFDLAAIARHYATFHEILGDFGQVYIAGGAVRDALLGREPQDIDVFILTRRDRDTSASNIRHALGQWIDRQKGADWANGKGQMKLTDKDLMIETTGSISRIAQVMLPDETPFDIVLRHEASVYELVKTFDWNICQFAYGWLPDEQAAGLYNPSGIPTQMLSNNQPGIIGVHNIRLIWTGELTPYRSMRRGFKFAERYGMHLAPETIRTLCRAVLYEGPKQGELMEVDMEGEKLLR